MKTCIVCNKEKDIDDFPNSDPKNHPGRKRPLCKVCLSDKNKARYAANPEIAKAYVYKNRLKDRAKYLEYKRSYLQQNSHQMDAYRAKRRLELSLQSLQWQRANPEKKRDCDQRRRARLQNAPVIHIIDRQAIIQRDRSICYLCHKELETKAITLDHVIPLERGGSHTAENLRVACKSCNCRKGTRTYVEYRIRWP